MRCMAIVKASKDSEAGILPTTELLTNMGKFNEELVKAGVMLAGEGLQPSSNESTANQSSATYASTNLPKPRAPLPPKPKWKKWDSTSNNPSRKAHTSPPKAASPVLWAHASARPTDNSKSPPAHSPKPKKS